MCMCVCVCLCVCMYEYVLLFVYLFTIYTPFVSYSIVVIAVLNLVLTTLGLTQ